MISRPAWRPVGSIPAGGASASAVAVDEAGVGFAVTVEHREAGRLYLAVSALYMGSLAGRRTGQALAAHVEGFRCP